VKKHFGIMEDWGDYEHPITGCDETLCGYIGEEVCENATDDWDFVTCKKCLRLKERYIEGCKIDEENIIKQMGEMADFFEKEGVK